MTVSEVYAVRILLQSMSVRKNFWMFIKCLQFYPHIFKAKTLYSIKEFIWKYPNLNSRTEESI